MNRGWTGIIHRMSRDLVNAVVLVLIFHLAGCASIDRGGRNAGPSLQVQFYTPQNAKLVMRETGGGVDTIVSRGPLSHRLEQEASDLAVYDLRPGHYGFAYTGASGASEAIVYGEVEILPAACEAAKRFYRHAFVPITLPSDEIQEAPHLHPVRDLSYTVGLEHRQFEHLKQGDVVTKVFFVADLERVKREYDQEYFRAINDIDRELSVLADREAYLNARYEEARERGLQRDAQSSVEDRVAYERFDWWGIEEPYVRISRKRQALAAEREDLMLQRRELEAERARRATLLRSLTIVNRNGALVLATPDLQLPFRDTVAQASELGDVVAIVRVGGRHQHWAANEFAANSDDTVREITVANAER